MPSTLMIPHADVHSMAKIKKFTVKRMMSWSFGIYMAIFVSIAHGFLLGNVEEVTVAASSVGCYMHHTIFHHGTQSFSWPMERTMVRT